MPAMDKTVLVSLENVSAPIPLSPVRPPRLRPPYGDSMGSAVVDLAFFLLRRGKGS